MYDRYHDIKKSITDPEKLQIQFPFDLEIVFIDDLHVILEYRGTEVNTQFDVFLSTIRINPHSKNLE